ncbi:MAG TPA: hypothetical protein VH877_07270 [Polyangia bacterium]|nr:hypothetical protein [Polyangia bacterium]
MRRRRSCIVSALLGPVFGWGGLAGCGPDIDAPLSLVTDTRILAVQAEPAEAAPGETVSYQALVASPAGTVTGASLAWAFCTLPKPPGENNVVAPGCLTEGLAPAGPPGPSLVAATPAAGCALFGPAVPPPGRPRDPDATGGYYQPLRAAPTDPPGQDAALFLSRITCELAQASAQVAAEFRARYRPNRNPRLVPASLRASLAAGPGPGDGSPLALDRLPAGQRIRFELGWQADAAETYPVFDPLTQSLASHRETLRLSWFATAGAFAAEHTGRGEQDPALSSDNLWTAPAVPGPVYLWVVLRDARGGSDFAGYALTVTLP